MTSRLGSRRAFRTLAVVAGLALVAAIGLTASNVVAASKRSNTSSAMNANEMKPTECNGLTLTAIVTGSGNFAGTGASELLLGGAGADTIRGNGGTDCLVGGSGDDTLRGGGGVDVCIGGAGTDTFINCTTTYQ
jgi:Ca2+-binding RTX toxin-like protein